jgi:hypothetical protein
MAEGTLDPYRPAMQLHQFLDQCQADPCALLGATPHACDAIKAFEEMRDFRRRDASPSIIDGQLHGLSGQTEG